MAKVKVKAYGGNKANPNAQTPKAKTYEGNKSTSAKPLVKNELKSPLYVKGKGETGKKYVGEKAEIETAEGGGLYKKKK